MKAYELENHTYGGWLKTIVLGLLQFVLAVGLFYAWTASVIMLASVMPPALVIPLWIVAPVASLIAYNMVDAKTKTKRIVLAAVWAIAGVGLFFFYLFSVSPWAATW